MRAEIPGLSWDSSHARGFPQDKDFRLDGTIVAKLSLRVIESGVTELGLGRGEELRGLRFFARISRNANTDGG